MVTSSAAELQDLVACIESDYGHIVFHPGAVMAALNALTRDPQNEWLVRHRVVDWVKRQLPNPEEFYSHRQSGLGKGIVAWLVLRGWAAWPSWDWKSEWRSDPIVIAEAGAAVTLSDVEEETIVSCLTHPEAAFFGKVIEVAPPQTASADFSALDFVWGTDGDAKRLAHLVRHKVLERFEIVAPDIPRVVRYVLTRPTWKMITGKK